MAKCEHETSNGRCGLKDCYAYRHKCYTEEFCKCHKPQTNADRIRAMDDETLAAQFVQVICELLQALAGVSPPEKLLDQAMSDILVKLRQPVEE